MNNIKYYNDSLAYDFDMFMPKTKKTEEVKDNIVVMPKKASAQKKRRQAAAKRLSPSVAAIMCTFFILAALCGNIALRLEINEVNSKINAMKSSLNELDSEKTMLEVELQRRISYSNLELEAVQLGMKKPSKEDVTYIRVNDKDAAKTSDGSLVTSQ